MAESGFKWRPSPAPMGGSMEDVMSWALQELEEAASVINNLSEGVVAVLNKAPNKPRNGMIRMADGTDWNPGGLGRGYYGFDEASNSWRKLG